MTSSTIEGGQIHIQVLKSRHGPSEGFSGTLEELQGRVASFFEKTEKQLLWRENAKPITFTSNLSLSNWSPTDPPARFYVPGHEVVATLSDRDLMTPSAGSLVFVRDPWEDSNLPDPSKGAFYIYDGASWQWVETMDPTTSQFVPAPEVGYPPLPENVNLLKALQDLGTAVEATGGLPEGSVTPSSFSFPTVHDSIILTREQVESSLQEMERVVAEADKGMADLRTLTGIVAGTTDFGTFSGSTIADNVSVRAVLDPPEKVEEETPAEDAPVEVVEGEPAGVLATIKSAAVAAVVGRVAERFGPEAKTLALAATQTGRDLLVADEVEKRLSPEAG